MCEWGNQEIMYIDGKKVHIDSCMVDIIAALNKAGMKTYSHCCGHGGWPDGDYMMVMISTTRGPVELRLEERADV